MKEYKVRQRYTQIDEELMSQFRTGDPMCTIMYTTIVSPQRLRLQFKVFYLKFEIS